jgi:hypothetical protein
MSNGELFKERVGLVMVDVQERMASTMPEKVLKGTLRNWLNLIEGARVLGLAAAVSEQAPKVLGRSLPVVAESVTRLPREMLHFFKKQTFSCAKVESFSSWIKRSGRKQWVVTGMEAHIAVYQTARDLCAQGYEVYVPRDAVVSRAMANWEIGLSLMERAGAIISSTETVIFDLLKQSGTEEFGILSRIIK